MKKLSLAVLLCITNLPLVLQAQQVAPEAGGTPPASKPPLEELRLKLNDGGSHYLKWTFLNQVWLRFNDSNPGTLVLNEPARQTFDIGLRRTRIQFYGQLTDHVFFYTQFGQNNFNFLAGQNAASNGNRKFQVFFHDALGEYKIWKSNNWLTLGGGLTIANGLSRFSQPAIGSIMTLDVPIFAQATVDQTDEFSRKLSIYARGQLGKLDYRVILSDPFPITSNGNGPVTPGPNATFAAEGHHKQYQGFFMWNFFQKENHTTPYMTGTYLGKKKIFNLEAGFITQKNAMWVSHDNNATRQYQDMKLWSAALFYDAPLNTDKGTALSAYAGYYNLDFGTNYLRYNGVMNPANGIQPGFVPNSQGNAFPMFGSGQVLYAQLGYLLRQNLLGENGTLMPYASIMRADYDRLSDRMNVWNVGMNWLIKGHSSKLTIDYQGRPSYSVQGSDYIKTSTRGQLLLQYQVFF
jgi:hypothetical protein